MKHRFSHLIEQVAPSGIRRFFDLVIGAKDVISLGVGEPDFSTPWPIRYEGVLSMEQGQTSYTSNMGLLECRQAVCGYLETRYQAAYNPASEIIMTVGVSEAVDITLRSILNPGDEVILPDPNYVCYAPLVQLAGGTPVWVDTASTQFIPTKSALAAAITPRTKAIILCTPNNPTGAVIPKSVLQDILDLAKAHDLWIISDEIYAELIYDEPFTSFASLEGAKPYCILLNGFSKAYAMTGWRLGYVCGSADFIQQAIKIHQYAALCAPIMAQYAAIEAIAQPEEVEKMRKSYEDRRNFFVHGLNEMGLKTPLPGGAFYCFPDISSTGLTDEEFALQLLEKARVAVVPGSVFGNAGRGHVRCCYATHADLLKEALHRIDGFLKTL